MIDDLRREPIDRTDHNPMTSSGLEDPGTETPAGMTRGQQTGWIIFVLLIMFGIFMWVFITKTDPTDRYSECWPFYTSKCKADVAVRRLMR